MFGIGVQELLLILFIVLILFGAKKVPELAKGLGTAVREFRKATKDIDLTETPPADVKPVDLPETSPAGVNTDDEELEEPQYKA